MNRTAYPSDLTDKRWVLIELLIAAHRLFW